MVTHQQHRGVWREKKIGFIVVGQPKDLLPAAQALVVGTNLQSVAAPETLQNRNARGGVRADVDDDRCPSGVAKQGRGA